MLGCFSLLSCTIRFFILLEGNEVCYACAVIYMFGGGRGGFILLLLKWLVCLSCLMYVNVYVCVCVGGGGGAK